MKRSRSTRNGDKLTAEFTSGQLVIGIVCALFFCVACFMLGILVGKLDPSLQPGETLQTASSANTPSKAPVPPAPAPAAAPPAKSPVGVQQSPRTDGLRPHSTEPAKSTELPPLPGAAPVKIAKETPGGTTRTRLDLPAGQATPPPAPVATPAAVPAAPAAVTTSAAPAAPAAATPPPAPLEPPAPATPVAMQAVDPPDAPATPVPAPKPASTQVPATGTPAKSGFAIQVASLTGANRDAGAAEFQKKFKKDTGLDCQAVPSANGGLRLMITGFASKEAANAANAELKKKRPDLSGAFVVAQP